MQEAEAEQWRRGNYCISTDRQRLDVEAIVGFLERAYWSPGVPRAVVERAIAGSRCFGLYEQQARQIGFARVVTDGATFGYLADVFVLEGFRGRGLGRWLVEVVVSQPEFQGFRRFLLATRDAHSLYRKFGFAAPRAPEALMEILRPDIYATPVSGD